MFCYTTQLTETSALDSSPGMWELGSEPGPLFLLTRVHQTWVNSQYLEMLQERNQLYVPAFTFCVKLWLPSKERELVLPYGDIPWLLSLYMSLFSQFFWLHVSKAYSYIDFRYIVRTK